VPGAVVAAPRELGALLRAAVARLRRKQF